MKGQNHVMEDSSPSEYVAVIPAAGAGTRLPDRELSKELLPYGSAEAGQKPVISHLVACLGQADIDDMIVVLRDDKTDIVDYLRGPESGHYNFRITTTPGTSGVPETVALGLKDAGARNVAFGFPDILFEPQHAFVSLKQQLDNSAADVVLGLFPTDTPRKMDMVATNSLGQVTEIQIKPESTRLAFTWILAAWTPRFSAFLASNCDGNHLGNAFQLAMAAGFSIDSVTFSNGRSLDIGTPDDLARASAWESSRHG
jgi:glucose-1-phosphate thymidylyltransferase